MSFCFVSTHFNATNKHSHASQGWAITQKLHYPAIKAAIK